MKDEKLANLFDYTKFHIGMYTTLIAGIIGIFANDTLKVTYEGLVPYIKWTIGLFLVAGAAGGMVASSIPFYDTFESFQKARIGPWRCRVFPSIACTHIEHTAFWIGLACAVYGLFRILPITPLPAGAVPESAAVHMGIDESGSSAVCVNGFAYDQPRSDETRLHERYPKGLLQSSLPQMRCVKKS